jgi:SIR2-like domain
MARIRGTRAVYETAILNLMFLKSTHQFADLLPLLVSRYKAGRLVPFIGAGMSREKLVGWEGFVTRLETQAGLTHIHKEHLDIRAQRAAEKLRHSGKDLIQAIRQSLKSEAYAKLPLPPQTAALAKIYWPLTISTNYDDFFYGACSRAFEKRLKPLILGRSANDCKRVMSSLASPFDREIIWHIQGFVGELLLECDDEPEPDKHSQALQKELVIGHSEYRKVTNTAVHFRRCFGEVFRTKSLLFLGSALSEEYFWNLFGEMLELCGPSPVPHFALIPRNADVDIRFLAAEMNITVLQYEDHSLLPSILGRLNRLIERPAARVSKLTLETKHANIEITPHKPLTNPAAMPGYCALALIVRTTADGQVRSDPDDDGLLRKFSNRRFAKGEHVIAAGKRLFAVRAHTGKPNETDSIGAAMKQLLKRLGPKCKVLHLHLPPEGGTVPPVYGFIEAIRAYGHWADRHPRTPGMIAYVGPQVLLNLTSRQIDLQELLSSPLIRFWAAVNEDISDAQGSHGGAGDQEPIRRVLYKRPETKLKDVLMEVLGDIDRSALETWFVSLCPSPRHDSQSPDKRASAARLADRSLCDVGIVFGSVLTLDRAPTPSPELLREGTIQAG